MFLISDEVKNIRELGKHKFRGNYVGVIIFYLVFLGIIPRYFYIQMGLSGLKYYLPCMDLIALIMSTSSPEIFSPIYQHNPMNFFSYLSTNLIRLIALTGISMVGLTVAKNHSFKKGLYTMIIMYAITFLIPTQIFIIIEEKLYTILQKYSTEDPFHRDFRWIRFLVGIFLATGFIIVEHFIIDNYII